MKSTIATIATVFLVTTSAMAGRSNSTSVTHLIVKPDHVAVYTGTSNATCATPNMWILEQDHPNYDQMYKGLLASKLAGGKVDIVGTGTCSSADARGERIHWAYVAQ